MITIDLNVPLKDIDGNDLNTGGNPQTIGKMLSSLIMAGPNGASGVMKMYDWAVSLHKGEKLIVDKTDAKAIREYVEQHEQLTILGKGQIMIIIDKAIEQENK
jgi:hypothetical protein